jgi:alkanesulfonate monooxygenase SsuD/methylene tetrahydromethanopterin reductase-like flavin-dependent oxidoreductase (luciferase family)
MRCGLALPNFGSCGDPRLLAELAHDAEAAGWDGYFLWDHVAWPYGEPQADPWVALGAVALRTERIRIGTLVTPLPRRRPWKLAREAVTLDHLSGGRAVLGVGAGGTWPEEWRAFGEADDAKLRAALLDEGLELLAGLLSGERVAHRGTHYRVEAAGFAKPLQRPRLPVWVAATWPVRRTVRRAVRWDGVVPVHTQWSEELTPAQISELAAYVKTQRAGDGPFELATFCKTTGSDRAADRAALAAYGAAGATWLLEYFHNWVTPLDEIRARIRRGPPRP